MDPPAFCPSPTPVEDYDASSDQEWAVEGIVGESTDAFGVKRSVFLRSVPVCPPSEERTRRVDR